MTAASTPASTDVLHQERMLPSIGAWIVFALMGVFLGVVLVPLSSTAAVVVGVLGAAAVCVIAAMTSPVIEVTRHQVRMGPAQISPDLLGEPEALDVEAWKTVMGTGFEPLAFHCTRGWIHTGVRVPLDDDDDPTPAWVVSSRRPQDLALALRVARSRE